MAVTPLIWLYFFRISRREMFVTELEWMSANNAIEPCLTAERDREYVLFVVLLDQLFDLYVSLDVANFDA